MEARLSSPTDIVGFRSEAQALLAQQVPPEAVEWRAPTPDAMRGLTAAAPAETRPRGVPRAASAIVPGSFVRLCEFVVQHRDPERFTLLYRLLWRLVHEPGLRHDPADADMARAQHMAHAVRRDIHKLKSNTRFRALPHPRVPGGTLQLAWCEPAHHIVGTVAPWLAKRNADVQWALMTPECSAYWDGQVLRYAPGPKPPLAPGVSDDDLLATWQDLFPH